MKTYEEKRAEAQERQRQRDKLTAEQQIAKLDALLGVGRGAKKERAKLERRLE